MLASFCFARVRNFTLFEGSKMSVLELLSLGLIFIKASTINSSFEIWYPPSYKALDSQDDLYGYPKGVVLLYGGGQVYDVVIEAWDSQAAYEQEYGPRMSDVTVKKSQDKFITILDNNPGEPENKKVIESFKLLP